MAFSDWDVVQSNTLLYAGLEIGRPVVGSGSLRLDNLNLLTTIAAATTRLNSSFSDRGFVKGIARTLMAVSAFNMVTGVYRTGLLCMMSTADVTGAGTSCYVAGFQPGSTQAAGTWNIFKFTNGLTGSATTLGSVSGGSLVPTTAYEVRALELTWEYDTAQFDSGIALVLKVGTAADFSNLSLAVSVIDISSPLTTSVGEGCVFIHSDANGGTPAGQTALFDTTSLTKLS